ncbi:DUF624 domain-containing protein [Glycomyces luteolus]|uniref:DUF624 domain-containing protein n=1 Tax=Glycomyces luteolus TaxID=2670330 RepID=A0A9X3SVH1_9ACTN|nr:DUF624 domain-containing protein [Glycomyces luteolus]MDA1362473.1 DUF624 domain-containing protein [Glycomyces luteolus]
MLRLNALWWLFTLAGGVLLGAAPATVAAAECVREDLHGRRLHHPSHTFARAWRRDLRGANLTLLPHLAVLAVLTWNYLAYSAARPDASAQRLVTLAALLVVLAVGCWLPGLYVHHEILRRRFLLTGLRFALANPVPTGLHLFVLAALGYASSRLALLPFVFAVGAWCYLGTRVAVRCFAQNEAWLASQSA